jgi:3-phenylpropionate/trans-cinnamate dioxygenase ferredoxin reductase component
MSVIIIGAGHAAGQLVASLRMEGYDGAIRIVGDESYPPYQRPPLSKQLLSGDMELEQVYLKPDEFYETNGVEMTLGKRVGSIDRNSKTITLDDGEVVSYGKLALTTGTRVRKLSIPGSDLDGIFYVRAIDDTLGLRDQFAPGKKLVVVGGGYIGLEVAAAARKQGMDVTVLEMADRVMNRVVAPEVSAFYEKAHRDHGVTIVTDVLVSGFTGDGNVSAVTCEDGSSYEADLAVVGVGVIPNIELAEAAGLACDNGIVVDNTAQTEDPDIVAAGDCTNHPNGIFGINLRLESVQNAVDQAKAAAKAICGNPQVYNAVPWFWSDQYDIKLQIVGLSQGYDQAVVRGDPVTSEFSVFYLRDGTLIAVDAINSPREYMMGRKLVTEHAKPDPARIADTGISVKELV